uniref:Arrestin-like N-terminal domain-containing protein n=1 Tax=Glossina palpalis gambiensis TaxID=67801 RepID=A0A1B0C3M1_9MUSC
MLDMKAHFKNASSDEQLLNYLWEMSIFLALQSKNLIRALCLIGIIITVSGFAEVRWTEHITKQDTHGERQKTIETYSASEIYYSNERYVYGQRGGTQMLVLPPGKYIFPFQTTIPANAPTSLNGAWGQIHHEVSVVVDRVMRYNNIFKRPYAVIVPHGLNLNPSNAQPLHKIDEKVFCWSLRCGNQGPMVMENFKDRIEPVRFK